MTNKKNNLSEWKKKASNELGKSSLSSLYKETSEKIKISPIYTKKNLEDLPHLDGLPGIEPYVRGPKATMYANRPWTIRQYAGYSTAEESNKFFIEALASGQKGLSIAFDLATHRGYDSDHKNVVGDVGKAGVAIDTVEDMKILFNKIPLDKISVSMTMNGAVLPVLASFIVAGEEQGVSKEKLSGTIQNDILKEFMVRNTYIYPPKPSMRIVSDIIDYTSKNLPKFNSVSISGYHMQEAGANLVQELSFTLADGIEYINAAKKRGLNIDKFAPRLSFFFCIGMNFFMEIAKLRAARYLWAKWIKKLFKPKNKESLILRTHCQTSGASLTEQDPYNNIVRTSIEAMSAVLGGTQSLHTNAFDEAIGLPTNFSSRIARNTQLILQNETDLMSTVDPLAGSYYIETLTAELIKKANNEIIKIQKMGGMTKAVENGYPKSEIEKMATLKQAKIDSGETTIVGVNKFINTDEESIDILEIDNKKVRDNQIKRLNQIKLQRDKQKVKDCLNNLKIAAKNDTVNLLELSIEAIKARATVGEITESLNTIFGQFKNKSSTSPNIYRNNFTNNNELEFVDKALKKFSNITGDKPKIYFAKIGQDGHDRGIKVVASAYEDFGMEVIVGDLFQTPEEIVKIAIELNVHIIGISSLAAGHKTLIPIISNLLKDNNAEDILLVCGGIIPKKDYNFLYEKGVAEIFGPGTSLIESAIKTLNASSKHLNRMHNFRVARINSKSF